MEETLLQYGIAGIIIILLVPAIKFVFDYITKTREKNDERWEKTFKRIVDDNKDREKQIQEFSKEREERILKALESQGETLKSINVSIASTNSEVSIIKRVLDELRVLGGKNG